MSHNRLSSQRGYQTTSSGDSSGANSVYLSGWIEIEEAKAVPINGTQELSINAWVYTAPRSKNGSQRRYPVLFTGTQAKILVNAYRSGRHFPKAVIHGSLFNSADKIFVLCKHIQVLDRVSTGPLPALRSAPTG